MPPNLEPREEDLTDPPLRLEKVDRLLPDEIGLRFDEKPDDLPRLVLLNERGLLDREERKLFGARDARDPPPRGTEILREGELDLREGEMERVDPTRPRLTDRLAPEDPLETDRDGDREPPARTLWAHRSELATNNRVKKATTIKVGFVCVIMEPQGSGHPPSMPILTIIWDHVTGKDYPNRTQKRAKYP